MDLATQMIRKGYAHALNVGPEPSDEILLKAQRDAIKERKGIWAHGVPDYILTSLHSIDEDTRREYAYNRLVSAQDGHSEKMKHKNVYKECQEVCSEDITIDDETYANAITMMRDDETLSEYLDQMTDDDLKHLVFVWLKAHSVAAMVPKEDRDILRSWLQEKSLKGVLKVASRKNESCLIYVDFRRRFGSNKAACLK